MLNWESKIYSGDVFKENTSVRFRAVGVKCEFYKLFLSMCNALALVFKYLFKKNMGEIEAKQKEEEFPGYPSYPSSEDIYSNEVKEEEINPENISETKSMLDVTGDLNQKGFEDDLVATDLDIPGSEIDDYQESIGAEDEENNYYSLGGDNHESLEEDSEGI